MKRWGKEERTEKKRRNHSLLQTYLVSLLSLCLSVCMLLGTTMAWFTSGVVVPQNEIYVGTLDVDLLLGTGDEAESLKQDPDAKAEQPKVFDASICWYPNHVETRTLTVVDQGEIPFTYKLTLTPGLDEEGNELDKDSSDAVITDQEQLELFRSLFVVYAREGALAEGETVNPQDLWNESEWTRIGNLNEIYDNALVVFSGESAAMVENEAKEKTAVHTIAVWMDPEVVFPAAEPAEGSEGEDAEEPVAEYTADDFQGFKLNFNIKLVANQMGTPEDAATEEQLIAALAKGSSVVLTADVELMQGVVLNNTMLNGDGKTLTLLKEAAEGCVITTTGGTIRNLVVNGAEYNKGCAIGSGDSEKTIQTQNLYIDNVTIDTVLYAINGEGDGKCKVVVTNSDVFGRISYANVANFDFVGCEIGEGGSEDGRIDIRGNTSFTDCTFSEFDVYAVAGLTKDTVVTFTRCVYTSELDPETEIVVTAAKFKDLFCIGASEEELAQLSGCTILVDGVQVDTTGWTNAN